MNNRRTQGNISGGIPEKFYESESLMNCAKNEKKPSRISVGVPGEISGEPPEEIVKGISRRVLGGILEERIFLEKRISLRNFRTSIWRNTRRSY